MKKFIIAFFLVAIALTSVLTINSARASGTTTIGIESSTQQFPSANVGDTIQVNIEISNVQGLWAWDVADLTFNPAILNITGVTEGPFLKAAGQDLFIWTSASTVDFAQGFIPDISDTLLSFNTESGSGVLATLTFQVLALGTSQIIFNSTTLDSSTNIGSVTSPDYQQIRCTNINANISVGPSSTSTPTSNPTSTPTTVPSTDSPSPTGSTNTASPTPEINSPTPNEQQAPEFPVITTLILLMIIATVSTVLLTKKAKLNKK